MSLRRPIRIVLVGIFCLLLCGNARAQDSLNVTKVGEIYSHWGQAYDAAVAGSLVYIADKEFGLRVADISDPSEPFEVGKCRLSGVPWGLDISGSYAYVAASNEGLRVVDISDPTSPMEVGFYDPGAGYSRDVVVSGSLAYLAGPSLCVVDISNPQLPTLIGTGSGVDAEGVAVSGSYAYIAGSYPGGLYAFDIGNPSNPILVGFFDVYSEDSYDVAVLDSCAYFATGGLLVIDISDPSQMSQMASCGVFASKVMLSDSFAYCTNCAIPSLGLGVVDITDPTQPVSIGFCQTPGKARGLAVDEYCAYVADSDSGLRVIDISNPADPGELGFLNNPGYVYNVAVAGSYAYIADGEGGLRVVDVTASAVPIEVGFCNLPGTAMDVDVVDTTAYLANKDLDGSYDGLYILDISDPMSPVVVSFCGIGMGEGVTVSGQYAYLAAGNSGLWIIRVFDPFSPAIVGSYHTGWAFDVAVSEPYAYVAAGPHGLRVLDISNPNNPTEVGYLEPGASWARGVDVLDSFAYMADSFGLRVIDISNPESPTQVGNLETTGFSVDVFVEGSHAYLAAGSSSGLRVVDVSDPTSPNEVGFYNTPGDAAGVFALDNCVFVADRFFFGIYDCSAALPVEKEKVTFTPTTYVLLPPYPNPFNPTTVLSFQLPVAGMVKLDVFDINGRKVVTQLAAPLQPDGWYSPGTHNILFDGAGLPSGIYLARLTTGDFSQVQKLVLMK